MKFKCWLCGADITELIYEKAKNESEDSRGLTSFEEALNLHETGFKMNFCVKHFRERLDLPHVPCCIGAKAKIEPLRKHLGFWKKGSTEYAKQQAKNIEETLRELSKSLVERNQVSSMDKLKERLQPYKP